MASSSTASNHKRFRYDVFLSFRGEDTRTNFIDHLYTALQQQSIYTYKDDEAIRKGKKISDELIQSIEDSKLYVIVFSKNYASSSWCLDELVRIIECHNTTEHTAYPVFYDVEPTEVRKQSGAVGEAFSKHENDEAAGKWKDALKQAADLAGWELKSTANGHEAKFIQKIVKEISLQLRSINYNIDEKLVGMNTRVQEVLSYIEAGIDDVRIIGIKGIGGGGKTTLARAAFDQSSFQFEGRSFVENVREVSNTSLSGLKSLQNQVLIDVLNDQGIHVSSVHDGKNMMKSRMCSRKVLVILDDVDHIDQLEALAGDLNWFKSGSRIIITTRDEQVLIAHRVKLILDVNLLSCDEAICLFSRYAFGRQIPVQEYEELSRQVVHYAAGLPLTIKVLGSFLCGKNENEWIDALERLKIIPLKETLKKLELSYMSLEDDYKEMFLDVACILKGWPKVSTIAALESCGFHAINGLTVLQQKSLITIYDDKYIGECVGMHDHLEEMGRNIVRRSHPDKPKKHSRLWIDEEIKDIFDNDLGTKATRYIRFYLEKFDLEVVMRGLQKMKELRFLHVSPDIMQSFQSERKYDNVSQYFPNALQYLHWYGYPLSSLPKTFQPNNLVSLQMPHSNIVQLWEGGERKALNKLKFLDLGHSKLTTIDLGLIPNLTTLSLERCLCLVQLHNLTRCKNLISVDLSDSNLKTVNLRSAVNLKLLNLKDCNALVELHLPDGCLKLTHLYCTSSKLMTLDIRLALNLEMLILDYSGHLAKLQMPGQCLNLKSLKLTYSQLRTLDIGLTPNLEDLDLRECYDLEELHMADKCQKLESLNIMNSKLRTLDIGLAPNLKDLDLRNCRHLEELHTAKKCQKLESLNIMYSKLRTFDIGLTPNLKYLTLNNCKYLEEVHISCKCEKLIFLNISNSKLKTLDLGLTPNLQNLYLKECHNLVEVHAPTGCLQNLVCLDLSGCLRFRKFQFNKRLGDFSRMVKSSKDGPSAELHLITKSPERCPLHPDNNLPKYEFECFYKDHPSLTRNLEMLISVGLCTCTNLETFSRSICRLWHLRKLKLEKYPEAPKDLGQLEYLEELSLSRVSIEHIPDSICILKRLKVLEIISCWPFEKLPEDLGQLQCLEKLTLLATGIKHLPDSICTLKRLKTLDLIECKFLEKVPLDLGQLESLVTLELSLAKITHIPDNICMLKHLNTLNLRGCSLLEKIPEDIGQLKCLVTLDLSSSKIKHLPGSICMLKSLNTLNLKGCTLLEKLPGDLGQLECLVTLDLSSSKVKHLPDSICILKHLDTLVLRDCSLLEKIPVDLGHLECLVTLDLSSTKIKHFPDSICMLKNLKTLLLEGCSLLENIPEDLGQLQCLVTLNLSSAKIKHLPGSFGMLKGLKYLKLYNCLLLEKLPEDLGRLECLEQLNITECKILRDIPDSISNMKYLKDLYVAGTCISHFPQNIHLLRGLRITGSRELLQSCKFRYEIEAIRWKDTFFVYV